MLTNPLSSLAAVPAALAPVSLEEANDAEALQARQQQVLDKLAAYNSQSHKAHEQATRDSTLCMKSRWSI